MSNTAEERQFVDSRTPRAISRQSASKPAPLRAEVAIQSSPSPFSRKTLQSRFAFARVQPVELGEHADHADAARREPWRRGRSRRCPGRGAVLEQEREAQRGALREIAFDEILPRATLVSAHLREAVARQVHETQLALRPQHAEEVHEPRAPGRAARAREAAPRHEAVQQTRLADVRTAEERDLGRACSAGKPAGPAALVTSSAARTLKGGAFDMAANIARSGDSMPVPVHILGGFLGTGKTSAIRAQLAARPGERVAVIVNDFGEAGLDAATLEGAAPYKLTSIPGGCVCCTAPEGFVAALGAVLDEKPDRVWIEPTGLARPQDLVDTIRRSPHQDADRDRAGGGDGRSGPPRARRERRASAS